MDITIGIFTTMEWAIPRRCLCLTRSGHHSGLTRRKKITDCDGLEERRAVLATALPRKNDPTYPVAAIAPLIIMEAVLAAS